MKIKAHALYFTLVVSLIIAIISGSIILAVFYYHSIQQRAVDHTRLNHNLESAIQIVLHSNKFSDYATSTFSLYNNGNDSVSITTSPWGVYDKAEIKAFSHGLACEASFLFGFQALDSNLALYLSDKNQSLKICGDTKLKGKCIIPKKGIERAYIAGKSYKGEQLIYGSKQISKSVLPPINKEKMRIVNSLLSGGSSEDVIELVDNYISDTISSKTLYSSSPVTLSANSCLTNVIITAPSITLEENFKGIVQLLAQDSINIAPACTLGYPSALYLSPKKDAKIRIQKDTRIEGALIALKANHKSSSLLSLEKDATFVGHAYSEGHSQINGTIYGTLYTNKFYLKTPASIYENHILDGTIDSDQLPGYFATSALFDVNSQKQIIKWLK